MKSDSNPKILFTGYAPVHFLCFQPLYERLLNTPNAEVFVSGGLKVETESGVEYDTTAMYAPFDIPQENVLSVPQILEQDFDVLFVGNTKPILPRSVESKVQLFHGISFRNRSIRPDNDGYDYYFIIGPYMHRRLEAAGIIAENDHRALPIGFMKTDRLLNGELDRSELLSKYGLDESRLVLLYAPTGEAHNSLETMGEEVIKQLVASDKYHVLIKLHDHPKNKHIDWTERLKQFEGKHCRVVSELDVIPLLYLADLLISDASSVSNEYSLLDRPMIFLDVPQLIKDAGRRKNTSLDLETWGRKGGIIVNHPGDIVEAVEWSLREANRRSDIRQAMADDLFYNAGSATDVAVPWLLESLA